MKMTMQLAMVLSLLAAPAFAKKSAKGHCVMKDGTDAAAKSKKACKKAGGKWMKGTAKSAAPSDTAGTTTTTPPPPDAAK